MSAKEPIEGDRIVHWGVRVLLVGVVVVEALAYMLGLSRSVPFRAGFIVIVLALAASLYSLHRTPAAERVRKMRSLAIALALGAFVAMFYAATIVRLGGNVLKRAL